MAAAAIGKFERHQSGRVVDEALASEHGGDPRRYLEPGRDRAYRYGIGGEITAPSANAAASGSDGISQCIR